MRSTCSQFVILLGIVAGATLVLHAAPRAAGKPLATLQSVNVTSAPGGIRVEIEASQAVALRSQVTTDPDRLVLDFPDTRAASGLHSKLLNQGEVKGFRVGRFSDNPPTTRVVIDLNRPQHFEIFPDGKTVIVKLTSDQQQASRPAPRGQRFLRAAQACIQTGSRI